MRLNLSLGGIGSQFDSLSTLGDSCWIKILREPSALYFGSSRSPMVKRSSLLAIGKPSVSYELRYRFGRLLLSNCGAKTQPARGYDR